jgi:hypothetical protein
VSDLRATNPSHWLALVGALACAAALPLAGCSGDPMGEDDVGDDDDEPDQPPDGDDDDDDEGGPHSALDQCQPASDSPMRALARRAENPLFNYGSWNDAEIAVAQQHDVVVLDPNDNVTREQVASIQGGTDPDDPCKRVVVLCYISIGEDIRTSVLSDAGFAADPRFRGDGSGPRMDPRGWDSDGDSLIGVDPLGDPSNGGTGWASYYLDDRSVRASGSHVGDGVPDRNPTFGGAYVNAGDPAWFDELQDMRYDTADKVAGLREILTTDYGRGLGCDGVFLDTIDTAAPNTWSSRTKYEWTAPGFAKFIQRLRDHYPDAVILQNRGVFFFHPNYEQYRFIPRGNIDYFLYESYRLNSSSSSDNPHHYDYPNNRFNFAPKILAEANRPDGFRVLSVGYAEGPSTVMNQNTLVGADTLGTESLLEDIRVTEELAGFRHYLTDSSLTLVNRFVADHVSRDDELAPVWTSTYNDNDSYPEPPGEPTARVGVRAAIAGPGSITVRWDVALDMNRVGYAVYFQTEPFDFAGDPALSGATRVVVRPRPTESYSNGIGGSVYANETTLTNLVPGETYHVVVRAFDDSPLGNEDDNQVVLTATPTTAQSYLGRWRASNGVDDLRYRFEYAGAWSKRRVLIDRDRIGGTGYGHAGIGADLKLEEGTLYRYTGHGSDDSWAAVRSVEIADGSAGGKNFVEWKLAIDDIGAGYRTTNVVFEVEKSGTGVTSTIHEHALTTASPAAPYHGQYVENDGDRVYFHADIDEGFDVHHIFIDDDANPRTGYAYNGVGAGYLIENGSLYRYVGPGWAWEKVGRAGHVVDGTSHDWSVARAELGATRGSPLFNVVFQAHGGLPLYIAPAMLHAFSR